MSSQDKEDKNFVERRHDKRINKNFVMSYYALNAPEKKYEITQLKNISVGGMCFIASREIENGTQLAIELKTPYLAETTYLEGTVLQSHEKVRDMLYETRIQMGSLDNETKVLLGKFIEFYSQEGPK